MKKEISCYTATGTKHHRDMQLFFIVTINFDVILSLINHSLVSISQVHFMSFLIIVKIIVQNCLKIHNGFPWSKIVTLGKNKFRTFLLTMQQQCLLFVVLVGRGRKISIIHCRFLIIFGSYTCIRMGMRLHACLGMGTH